jgi:hypothetical protein
MVHGNVVRTVKAAHDFPPRRTGKEETHKDVVGNSKLSIYMAES